MCPTFPYFYGCYNGLKNNYFRMFVSKPIKIDKNKSILEITKFLNNLLERMILRNIDQWIWTHNRWKD